MERAGEVAFGEHGPFRGDSDPGDRLATSAAGDIAGSIDEALFTRVGHDDPPGAPSSPRYGVVDGDRGMPPPAGAGQDPDRTRLLGRSGPIRGEGSRVTETLGSGDGRNELRSGAGGPLPSLGGSPRRERHGERHSEHQSERQSAASGSPPPPPKLSAVGPQLTPERRRGPESGFVMIQAPTLEEAKRRALQEFGDGMEIVSHRAVRRGGMLGIMGATGVEAIFTRGGARPPAGAIPEPPREPPGSLGDGWSPGWIGAETPARPAPARPTPGPTPRRTGFDPRRVQAGRAPGSADSPTHEELLQALYRIGERASEAARGVTSDPARSASPPTNPVAGMPTEPPGSMARPGLGALPTESAAARSAPAEAGAKGHPVVAAARRWISRCGISDELGAELLTQLSQRPLPTLSGDRSECEQLARLHLRELIRPIIPQSRPIPRPATGRRRIVSLVGPTGVGKTTTLAKLGAHFRFTEETSVGFITLDTYRIGAVDQLRRYAEILRVPLEVASPGESVETAVERLGDVEVILIDTAGRSQKDADRIHELRQLLGGMGELEVHLCLALSAAPEAILHAAENFKVVGYSRLILTKIDESYRRGVLLDLFRREPTAVSYLTVGQEVPDDFHPATSDRIEDLLLGES